LYYAIAHFSKFVRPNAQRIGFDLSDDSPLWTTAFLNEDGSIVVALFNPEEQATSCTLKIKGAKQLKVAIDAQALQTIVLR
jgi:glucosylceramidase